MGGRVWGRGVRRWCASDSGGRERPAYRRSGEKGKGKVGEAWDIRKDAGKRQGLVDLLLLEDYPPRRDSQWRMGENEEDLKEYAQQAMRDSLLQQQIEMERDVLEKTKAEYDEILTKMKDIGRAASLKPGQKLIMEWYQPLIRAVQKEQKSIIAQMNIGKSPSHAPYFLLLEAEKVSIIALHTAIALCFMDRKGSTILKILDRMGELMQVELNLVRLKNSEPRLAKVLTRHQSSADKMLHRTESVVGSPEDRNHRIRAAGVMLDLILRNSKYTYNTKTERVVLSPPAKVNIRPRKIRKELLDAGERSQQDGEGVRLEDRKSVRREVSDHLLNSFGTTMEDEHERVGGNYVQRRGFLLEKVSRGKHMAYVLRLHEDLHNHADSIFQDMELTLVRQLPMVVPPKPWTNPLSGGYMLHKSPLVRYTGSREVTDNINSRTENLDAFFESLNVLGETPWQINKRVYEVMQEAWEMGGGIAEIPTRKDLETPVRDPLDDDIVFYRQCAKVKQLNYDLHGLRCSFRYKLDVAKRFKEQDAFYFPHNVDFRGRTYPIPPHLNHVGSDIDRGLLLFADAKGIGEKGLFWMKVHLANIFGNNKIPFADRARWTEQHYSQVMESAEDPLRGSRWWTGADDPWQALALCMELRDIYLLPPEKRRFHESCIPVHMDGSCNGLQHYAALGGDVDGARQVNLISGPEPQDVYSGVVRIVTRLIAEEAQQGVEMAKLLDGKVDRKVIKQTVMTSVYGVTFVGARQQIENALKDRDVVDEELYWEASAYIARLTFASLSELFSGARNIMTWLGDCARVCAANGTSVSWTTPLGLPVTQPYRQTKNATLSTAVQRIKLIEHQDSFPLNVQKQRTAFPPNYVHSLDSTHMLLTAREMRRRGLRFASVHDSYWTHALDIDAMGKVLRQQFVELHTQPLLENLLQELQDLNPSVEFPPLPIRGPLDMQAVLDSPYFFH